MPHDFTRRLSAQLSADGRRRLEDGEILFRAEAPVTHLYLLRHGCIRLLRPLRHGDFLTLHRALPGSLLAEASLYASHYHCDAVTEGDCEVQYYERERVRAWLRHDPLASERLCHDLAREVQRLRTRLELAHIASADERLLAWLQLHATAGDGRVQLDRPLKQVASELGLAHETLYRSLRRLCERGSVQRQGARQFTLVASPQGLRR